MVTFKITDKYCNYSIFRVNFVITNTGKNRECFNKQHGMLQVCYVIKTQIAIHKSTGKNSELSTDFHFRTLTGQDVKDSREWFSIFP